MKNILEYLQKIKPTVWDLSKTEGIDFDCEFLWFDDNCFETEKMILTQNSCQNSWIEIDLKQTPNQMEYEIELLKSFVEE